jgi:glycine/D-amino acid oxidase-like deaminating enzyme
MPRSAEAVVVGGGVVGAAIAFNLARLGMSEVVVLEKGSLAAQASGRSGALVRAHYTNKHEVRLALSALPWFENWAEMVGGDCGFVRTGFLQLVQERDLEKLRQNVEMLRRLGVETRLVDRLEISELQSDLVTSEGELGGFEPRGGYADPIATTRGFAAAAERQGVEVCEGARVDALRVRGGRVEGVETADGPIAAPIVALANGPWAEALVRPFGVSLPIYPTRIQLAVYSRPPSLPRGRAGHLTLIDRAHGYYLRPEGEDSTLFGLSGYHRPLEDLDNLPAEVEADFLDLALRQVRKRIPAYREARFLRGQVCALDVTEDGRAILDRVSGVEGLFLAVGMSGTGFKKAPAVGACIAELITTGQATTAPIAPFRLARFAESDLITGNEYTLPEEAIDRRERAILLGRGLVH